MSEIGILKEIINKLDVLGGKIDGLGENLWNDKTKEEWSKIDEVIKEISRNEFIEFTKIQYKELKNIRKECKKEFCCKVEEMLCHILYGDFR